jgi:transposase
MLSQSTLWNLGNLRTSSAGLLALSDWLRSCGVTHVAMESTGVYWKPVWNLLEGQFEVLPVNCIALDQWTQKRTSALP